MVRGTSAYRKNVKSVRMDKLRTIKEKTGLKKKSKRKTAFNEKQKKIKDERKGGNFVWNILVPLLGFWVFVVDFVVDVVFLFSLSKFVF